MRAEFVMFFDFGGKDIFDFIGGSSEEYVCCVEGIVNNIEVRFDEWV